MRKFFILLGVLLCITLFIYSLSNRSSPNEKIATLEEIQDIFGEQKILKLDGTDFITIRDSFLISEISTYIENENTFLKIKTIPQKDEEVHVHINISREYYNKDNKSYVYGILTIEDINFFVVYPNGYELVKNQRFSSSDF